MNLIDAILAYDLRVACQDRWLVIEDDGLFVVYEKRNRRWTYELLKTDDEAAAVAALTQADES